MDNFIEMSFYLSDESSKKRATVYKNLKDNTYHVSLVNDTGNSFVAIFDKQENADIYAEDWVLK